MNVRTLLCAAAALSAAAASADPAEVLEAKASRAAGGWTVSVTLRHADTGWEDYADGWRVLAPDGAVLGTRVLHHPHVAEQPFTRSLSGVTIPMGLDTVLIESRTSVTGWGGDRLLLSLPR